MATKTHLARQEEAILETGIQSRPTDPGSPFLSQMWLNTTENVLKWYDGSSIKVIAQGNNGVINVGGTSVDGNLGNTFSKTISANTNFSFANIRDGQMVHIIITASGANRTVSFPSVENAADVVTTVINGKTVVYTFIGTPSGSVCLTPVRNEAFYGA